MEYIMYKMKAAIRECGNEVEESFFFYISSKMKDVFFYFVIFQIFTNERNFLIFNKFNKFFLF